jgi:hypothetical protein
MKRAAFLLIPLLLTTPLPSAEKLPVVRARITETKEAVEMWDGACSLYCAVGPELVRSSSRLAEKGRTYPADQAHDWDLDTAWVEGKPGYGVGEYLEYVYDLKEVKMPSLTVHTVHVFNGYRKSPDLWRANGRVKRFRLKVNGAPRAYFDLKDSRSMQTLSFRPIPLPPGEKTALRFEIVSVYPGARHQDTAVTDLTFDGGGHH